MVHLHCFELSLSIVYDLSFLAPLKDPCGSQLVIMLQNVASAVARFQIRRGNAEQEGKGYVPLEYLHETLPIVTVSVREIRYRQSPDKVDNDYAKNLIARIPQPARGVATQILGVIAIANLKDHRGVPQCGGFPEFRP